MSWRSRLMPHLAASISSPFLKQQKRHIQEFKRRLKGSTHQLDVFIKIDDPYSFLIVQALGNIEKRFNVEIRFYTVQHLPEDMFPEQQMWQQNAFSDARWLATLYQLDYPETLVEQNDVKPYLQALLEAETQPDALPKINTIFRAYLYNEPLAQTNNKHLNTEMQLRKNEQQLQQLGHYMSGMIHYGGEWYWGLDRLDHLEQRLIEVGVSRDQNTSIHFDLTWRALCSGHQHRKRNTPLEIFFSARSPYSYLGLERAAQLCQHHDIELKIKPVLPMVMRGMKIPDTKKMYIFLDAKREAEKLGIPYGKVADPLGIGVERCNALFKYAENEGKALDYLLSFARRVNTEGVLSETDAGMKHIIEKAGLNWEKAKPLLEDNNWRVWAKQNLDELLKLGLWGVPCFRYGDLIVWGQDRLYRIEQAITSPE